MTGERTPAISVIVPVYNVVTFLPACLDSLLAQTHDDFEILVVDDGSTDGSATLIASYAQKHPHIIRAFTKPNGGLGDARNFGMEQAGGEYLAFVDSDDLVAPTFLSSMLAAAEEHGADLVLCGIVPFTDPASPVPYLPEPDLSVFGHSLAQEPRLLYRVDASACDKLYARRLFEASGVKFPVGMAFEDVPTVYRMLDSARCVVKVDEPLYLYRQERADSITGSHDESFFDLVAGLDLVGQYYQERGTFETNRDALLRLFLTHLIAGRYPDLFLRAEASVRQRFVARAFTLVDRLAPTWRHHPTCRELWPNPILRAISTNFALLDAFCRLPTSVYLRLLARMGAFDPAR